MPMDCCVHTCQAPCGLGWRSGRAVHAARRVRSPAQPLGGPSEVRGTSGAYPVAVTVRLFCTQRQELCEVPASGPVNIYVCGITPYDSTHLGHVATFLTYDVLARRLTDLGHNVLLVRNITDLDDPILGRVQQLGTEYWKLVESEIAQFQDDMKALNALTVMEPRVSHALPDVIEAIEELVRTGCAYTLDDVVYFDVSRDPEFGKVSGYSM